MTGARMQASMRGEETYVTGKPCKYGHLSARKTANGECIQCRDTRFNTAEYRGIHKESQKRSAKAWSTKPENKIRRWEIEQIRRWLNYSAELKKNQEYKQRPDVKVKSKEHKLQYRALPENKKKIAAYSRAYVSLNVGAQRWRNTKRYQAMLQATPIWSDKLAIAEFYKLRPDGMQVDHIIPIQGVAVCGLHVYNNLQYLTPSGNAQKKNKFDPTQFEEIQWICKQH